MGLGADVALAALGVNRVFAAAGADECFDVGLTFAVGHGVDATLRSLVEFLEALHLLLHIGFDARSRQDCGGIRLRLELSAEE